jgi:hypothetical protein
MSVEPIDPHGIVRRNGVDPVVPWKLPAPLLVIPIAAGDPRAGRHCRSECLDPSDELGGRLGVAKLYGREPEAAVDEVDVRVDESRHDHAPGCVDHPGGARDLSNRRARAHGRDLFASDGERLGPWASAVTGPNARVDDSERHRFSGCSSFVIHRRAPASRFAAGDHA